MLLGPHVVEGILNFGFSLLVAGGRMCGVVLLLLPLLDGTEFGVD